MLLFLVTIGLIILCFTVGIIIISKKINELQTASSSQQTVVEWLKTMQVSLESTNKAVNDALHSSSNNMVQTLQENAKQLHQRLDKTAQVMMDMNREVGKMSEIGKNMQELQDFLKSPKLRGNIGEQILKDLIMQIFPRQSFYLQYQFASGDRVDAAIKTDAGLLPIDAKFPMENFQRITKASSEGEKEQARKDFVKDMHKHIDTIAKKYILPSEGTMDFALLYVPSETVFYEVISLSDLLEYARQRRVYMVSPGTLYAHLQTILLSFEGRRIETKAKEVFQLLRALQVDYDKVYDSFGTLGKHLHNASGQFSLVQKGVVGIGDKIASARVIEDKSEEKEHLLHTP